MSVEDRDLEFHWLGGEDLRIVRARRRLKIAEDLRPHLVDTTMLYAPRSGGVKRYLTAKRAWRARARQGVRHTLVVPGARSGVESDGTVSVKATKLPFGDGYRWPSSVKKWAAWVESLNPSVIEAGDPYTPGQAALEAGQRAGVPVVGFCHSDPAALAALHFGEWAKKPVEKRWAKLFKAFDRVVAPSHFIASRLGEAGVEGVVCQPLGVDVETFRPERRDRPWLLRRLGLPADARLLMFAGRPAREKNIDVLIDAVQRLGDPYHLVLVGAGAGQPGALGGQVAFHPAGAGRVEHGGVDEVGAEVFGDPEAASGANNAELLPAEPAKLLIAVLYAHSTPQPLLAPRRPWFDPPNPPVRVNRHRDHNAVAGQKG